MKTKKNRGEPHEYDDVYKKSTLMANVEKLETTNQVHPPHSFQINLLMLSFRYDRLNTVLVCSLSIS